MRYASAMMRSANPKAWNVSTLRAWIPSAWPIAKLPRAPLHNACGDVRELGELRRGQHSGRATAHDEDINFVRKLGRAIDSYAGGRLDSGVTGYVTVVVELHGLSSLLCGLMHWMLFDNRTGCSIIAHTIVMRLTVRVQVVDASYAGTLCGFLRNRATDMSGSGMPRLMLLDTASLYFRAFYGVPDSIRRADGTPVNAVRGLMDMIARLTTDYEATHLVACWDNDWRPQWRVDLIPSYKSAPGRGDRAPTVRTLRLSRTRLKRRYP
jgi:hypothetical protein